MSALAAAASAQEISSSDTTVVISCGVEMASLPVISLLVTLILIYCFDSRELRIDFEWMVDEMDC